MRQLLFRTLLLPYPRCFREEYERELRWQFNEDCADRGLLRAWLAAAPDALTGAVRLHLDLLRQDLRHLWRTALHQPRLVLAVLLLLGVGLGATTAVGQAAYALLLRPLPYPDAQQLVVTGNIPNLFALRNSPGKLQDLVRESNGILESAAVFSPGEVNLTSLAAPIRVNAAEVTPGFFTVLGRPFHLGAGFTPQAADSSEAVISYSLWQTVLGGNPRVLGTSIEVNGLRRRIVAVAAPGVDAPHKVALWVASDRENDGLRRQDGFFFQVLARLRPGVTLAQATDWLLRLQPQRSEPISGLRMEINLHRLQQTQAGTWTEPVLLLSGATGLLLLLASASAASLLLARLVERRNELTVRLALGAPVARLRRQFATEAMAYSLLGAVLAVGIGTLVLRLVPAWLPDFPAQVELSAAGIAASIGAALLVGLALSFAAARESARLTGHSLHQGTRATRNRLARLLLTAQVALATVLLVGTGLFGRSLTKLLAVDLGLRTEGVIAAQVSLVGTALDQEQRSQDYYRRAAAALRTLPGVTAAGAINQLPLHKHMLMIFPVQVRGQQLAAPQGPFSLRHLVTPDYFRVMRIRLLAGRGFSDQDTATAPRVVIVSERLARQFDTGLLGREINLSSRGEKWARVIGIAREVHQIGPQADPFPDLYQPLAQGTTSFASLVVHTADPAVTPALVQSTLQQLDSRVPVYSVRPMDAYVADSLLHTRLLLALQGSFAAFACLLALSALAAMVAQHIAATRQEVGVRIALGATASQVQLLLTCRHLTPLLLGIITGLAGAAAASRWAGSQLHAVEPLDASVYAAAGVLFLVVSVATTLIIGRRATRIDPAVVLRAE